MTAIDKNDEVTDSGPLGHPLARLFAGGRHVRLLLLGRSPDAIILPRLDGFDRVAWLVRPGDAVPGCVIADPLRLPFIEALFDRALVTTLLSEPDAQAELRELWRVLAPAGLAVLAVKARRRWQFQAAGWTREALEPLVSAAMFEVLDWQTESLPDRWHLVLVAKIDGLRPAMIGRVSEGLVTANAT